MEDKILDKSVTHISYDIGIDRITNKKKKLLVSPSGTRFTVMVGNNNYGVYELKPRLTEKFKLVFVLENPFGIDKIFECDKYATLIAIDWIISRERGCSDEIS